MKIFSSFGKYFNIVLDRIDEFFESRKQSERTIILYTPAIAIVYATYIYLFPIVDDLFLKSKRESENIINQIFSAQGELSNISAQNSVLSLKNEIDEIEIKVAEQAHKRLEIENIVFSLSNSQKRWHEILSFISESAENRKIDIKNISSVIGIEGSVFGLKNSEISIDGSGDFYNVLMFLNDIESYGDYVEIKNIEFIATNSLEFKLKIEGWRVSL